MYLESIQWFYTVGWATGEHPACKKWLYASACACTSYSPACRHRSSIISCKDGRVYAAANTSAAGSRYALISCCSKIQDGLVWPGKWPLKHYFVF